MIQSIIFDWGGVLIEDPTPGMVSYFAQYFKLPHKKLLNAWPRFMVDFQCGRIEEHEAWRHICLELGVDLPQSESLWKEAFQHVYHEQKEVWDLVYFLKQKGFKLGFLSNTEKPAMEFFHTRGYEGIFDVLLFSCTFGNRKPEVAIFRTALKHLASKPHETVFIDDRADYLVGAKKVGIHAIHFKSPQQLKDELNLLGIPILD